MGKQPSYQGGMSNIEREMVRRIYADLNSLPGRFIGAFASTDLPSTTDNSLAYCQIWVTNTHKPAWLDPFYPRWQYADGSAV